MKSDNNRIRTYRKKDQAAIINLLRLNTPPYFAPEEEAGLKHFLEHEREDYFVVEKEGEVVASGGINYGFGDDGKEARLSWDIVHPHHQGKGIGRELVLFRLKKLNINSDISTIAVRTSQLTEAFYEKTGFRTEYFEEDYWGEGIHLCHMTLGLEKNQS